MQQPRRESEFAVNNMAKPRRKGGNVFWGLAFIVIGSVLLLNYLLGVNLPLFRILISVGIIYFGVSLLFGSFGLKLKKVASEKQTVFTENEMKWADPSAKENDFDTVFGKARLDLTHLGALQESKTVNLNAVLGELTVELSPETAYTVESQAVMGSVVSEGKKHAGLGENEWHSSNYVAGVPHLKIVINSVLGQVIINRKAKDTY